MEPLHLADMRSGQVEEGMKVPRLAVERPADPGKLVKYSSLAGWQPGEQASCLLDNLPGELVPHRPCYHCRGWVGLPVQSGAERVRRLLLRIVAGSVAEETGLEEAGQGGTGPGQDRLGEDGWEQTGSKEARSEELDYEKSGRVGGAAEMPGLAEAGIDDTDHGKAWSSLARDQVCRA